MPRSRFIATLLLMLCATGPARTLDPKGVDLLMLRLGMTEAEVTAVLAAQAYTGPDFQRSTRSCTADRVARCEVLITTRTMDGRLDVRLARVDPILGVPVATSIVYTFDGRRPGEREAIAISAQERYGRPDIGHPMTWCRLLPGQDRCAPGSAQLTLRPGTPPTQVLALTDGEP